MDSPPRCSIVIPCYNEEKNVPIVLQKFAEALAEMSEVELLVVDNGSQDRTGRVIEEEIQKHQYTFSRKVTVPFNRGYGFGIVSGLREACGSVLAWTHADLQTDPLDVVRAYQKFLEESQNHPEVLVKGRRRSRRLLEQILTIGMQLLTSMVLKTWLVEINAQPKVFPRALYERMTNPPEDFMLDLYVLYLAKRLGYRIVSIPVTFADRIYGEAKGGGGGSLKNRWRLIQDTLRYMVKLRSTANVVRASSC